MIWEGILLQLFFKIVGKRVNGKDFKLAIHQNIYVIDFGSDGQDGTITKWIHTRTKEKNSSCNSNWR